MTDQPARPLNDATERRAETLSLIGMPFQLILAGFLWYISQRTASEAASVLTFFILPGILIWFALWLLSRQQRMVALEALELEQLRREREITGTTGGAIFEVDSEELSLAQRRLRGLLRFGVPIFTLLIAASEVLLALYASHWPLVPDLRAKFWPALHGADVGAGLVLGAAFVTFLLSRYAVGLAKLEPYQHLRAGASYLFGNAMMLGLLGVSLGLVHFDVPIPERVLAVATRWLMLLLGAEFLILFVFDFYRPRVAGEMPRTSFDSRFLATFSETAGIARNIAEAINYQFGFEVSKTWFYLLMKRSMIPLLYFGAFCLILSTTCTVVDTGHVAVIERFGKPVGGIVGPGIHFKLPWPVSRAYQFDPSLARQVTIGFSEERVHEMNNDRSGRPILWTNRQHGGFQEMDLLVATPRGVQQVDLQEEGEDENSDGDESRRGRSVPVSIFRAVAVVDYRVRDVQKFNYDYAQGDQLVKDLAQRELVQYAASVDQEQFLSAGRESGSALMLQHIQDEADRLDLGVDILLVQLLGVHPAQEVAKAYHDVVGAEQEREGSLQDALKEQNETLTGAVGDVRLARELADAINNVEALSGSTAPEDQAKLADAKSRRDMLMSRSAGQVSKIVADAEAEQTRVSNEARGRVEEYRKQVVSYRAAPKYYVWTTYFDRVADQLAEARKFLVAYKKKRDVMVIIDTGEESTLRLGE